MRQIHLADAENRDTHVSFVSVSAPPPPTRVGPDGRPVMFRRFIAAGDANTEDSLTKAFGPDYSKALIDGDPEVDAELVGRPVGPTTAVYLSLEGDVLRCAPSFVEVLIGPDGIERERRPPVDTASNILEQTPVRWTRMRMKRADAVRRFAFSRSIQLVHVDGLTYDYLYGLAKQLDTADELVLLGGGASGRDPLVFHVNGVPWRAFLEGRVDGPRYKLLLRLSNLELKAPEEKP